MPATSRLEFGASLNKPNRWVIMPTLFRVGPYRVVVYPNDHSPAHVHAVGAGHAKFVLGSTADQVAVVEITGISVGDLRKLAETIIDRHAECCAGWSKWHGD